jgi:hypothetical protein
MTDQWINERLVLLRSLKTLNDHQRLLLMLADKWPRTTHDERKLAALVKAEKAAERAEKARNSASCIIDQEKLTERKTRNHRAILKDGPGREGSGRTTGRVARVRRKRNARRSLKVEAPGRRTDKQTSTAFLSS